MCKRYSGDRAIIACGGFRLDMRSRTLVMGILNITPDSFSDGNRFLNPDSAVKHGLELEAEGADILDIGGESSRPGSESVPVEEELKRTIPVIRALAAKVRIPISIDTTKAEVAEAALQAGACIVNDISAMALDASMKTVVARHGAAVVLMHMKGVPKTMQETPVYEDVVGEVRAYLKTRIREAEEAGIDSIIIDPGIGFGKTLEHNLELLKNIEAFSLLERPILIGPSRKNFIGILTGLPAAARDEGTLAAVTSSVLRGAHMVRVHNVRMTIPAVKVADALRLL